MIPSGWGICYRYGSLILLQKFPNFGNFRLKKKLNGKIQHFFYTSDSIEYGRVFKRFLFIKAIKTFKENKFTLNSADYLLK